MRLLGVALRLAWREARSPPVTREAARLACALAALAGGGGEADLPPAPEGRRLARHLPRGRQVDASSRRRRTSGPSRSGPAGGRGRTGKSTTRAARSPRRGPGPRWHGRWGAAISGAFGGRKINSAPVARLLLLFLLGLGAGLRRPLSMRNLDCSCCFRSGSRSGSSTAADIFTSVPLAYPPLLYYWPHGLEHGGRGSSARSPSPSGRCGCSRPRRLRRGFGSASTSARRT
jgi:hypothetical protein